MAGLGWEGVFNGRFNHPQKPKLSELEMLPLSSGGYA
jgi:hypothetical protein